MWISALKSDEMQTVVFTYGRADYIGFLTNQDTYQRTALMTGLVCNKIPPSKAQSYVKRKGNTEGKKAQLLPFFQYCSRY